MDLKFAKRSNKVGDTETEQVCHVCMQMCQDVSGAVSRIIIPRIWPTRFPTLAFSDFHSSRTVPVQTTEPFGDKMEIGVWLNNSKYLTRTSSNTSFFTMWPRAPSVTAYHHFQAETSH